MTESEAFDLIEIVGNAYHMEFTEKKARIWISLLTKDGNFEKSKVKLLKLIDESPYQPKIADFKVNNKHNNFEQEENEIAEEIKKANAELSDPAKREQRQRLIKKMNEKMKQLKESEQYET